MKLILVTSFDTILYEHYLINLLFCEGLEYLHLRKRDYTEEEMEEYIQQIAPPFRKHVILHSHFHLIQKYELKGAHFTKDSCPDDLLPDSNISTLTKPFTHLSFSLHTIAEIKSLPNIYDYIFLSPVFDSISNQGFNSRFQPGDLKAYLYQDIERPEIIALSGIMPENIDKAMELGFDGVAMLGHIWTPFERDQNLVQAVQRFNRVQKLINFFKENPTLVQSKK